MLKRSPSYLVHGWTISRNLDTLHQYTHMLMYAKVSLSRHSRINFSLFTSLPREASTSLIAHFKLDHFRYLRADESSCMPKTCKNYINLSSAGNTSVYLHVPAATVYLGLSTFRQRSEGYRRYYLLISHRYHVDLRISF